MSFSTVQPSAPPPLTRRHQQIHPFSLSWITVETPFYVHLARLAAFPWVNWNFSWESMEKLVIISFAFNIVHLFILFFLWTIKPNVLVRITRTWSTISDATKPLAQTSSSVESGARENEQNKLYGRLYVKNQIMSSTGSLWDAWGDGFRALCEHRRCHSTLRVVRGGRAMWAAGWWWGGYWYWVIRSRFSLNLSVKQSVKVASKVYCRQTRGNFPRPASFSPFDSAYIWRIHRWTSTQLWLASGTTLAPGGLWRIPWRRPPDKPSWLHRIAPASSLFPSPECWAASCTRRAASWRRQRWLQPFRRPPYALPVNTFALYSAEGEKKYMRLWKSLTVNLKFLK